MGSFSVFHWLIVLAVILILFGAGKLPSVAGDLAKSIKAFRAGMKDDEAKGDDTPANPASVAMAPPLQAVGQSHAPVVPPVVEARTVPPAPPHGA